MAATFPLSLDEYSDRIRVASTSFHCPTPKSISRTRGGQVLQARLGPSLWQGEVRLGFRHIARTQGVRALTDMLLDENASFILSPHDYFGPAMDPFGASLGGSEVKLHAVAANNADVTLSGLPGGYVLSGDDLFSFTYGRNPVRYAMHRIVFAATAGGGGGITVQVWPKVEPGWQEGATVRLLKPRIKAVMEDREAGASAGIFHDGMSFSFIQTLR